MERDEAKAILELCRPGMADDQRDPLIAEALRLLDRDAELKAWFDEQQALDARIGEAFNAIVPPADLKASILAGMRAHTLRSEGDGSGDFTPNQVSSSQVSGPEPFATSTLREPQGMESAGTASGVPTGSRSQAWWRKPWIGVAAVFALLFVIFAMPRDGAPTQLASPEDQTLQAGVPDMIQFLANEIDSIKSQKRSFAMQSDRPETLQAYLAGAGAPSPTNLPSPLRTKPSMGCFTLDYKGVKMGMICFNEDQAVHLITVEKSDCPKSFQPAVPTIYEVGNQVFKAWTDGEQVYIISTEGSKEKLPKFI